MSILSLFAKATILLLFLYSNPIQSQDISDDMDIIFGQLDLSNLTTNYLLDKGLGLKNWETFDGNFPTNDLSNNIDDWFWHYTCLETAQVGLINPFIPRSRYIALIDTLDEFDVIPLSVLTLAYDQFKKTALDEALIFLNSEGVLEDNPQATSSAYERDSVFIGISTLENSSVSELSFVLPDSLILSNLGSTTFEIDFDDGLGFRIVIPNRIETVSYTEIGPKVITFKFDLDNSQSVYAKSQINITALGSGSREYSESPDETINDLPFGTKANIFYGSECGVIRKPLIYVEGFNPKDFFPTDYNILFKKLDLSEGNGQQYHYPPGTGPTLWDEFSNQGYDFIFVDFGDGAGDIFNNAVALKEVIRQVNTLKAQNNIVVDNTIIGASMGGLIAYRALTTFENEGYDHEVEDFFSFDSPLRGANIPFGLQSFVDIFGNTKIKGELIKDKFPALALVEKALNSPATKQMLYYHVKSPGAGKTFLHDQFYAQLHEFGPPNVNHIAIANGSGIGQGQLIQPGQQLLDIGGFFENPDGAGGLLFAILEVYFGNLSQTSFRTVYKQRLYVKILGNYLPIGGYHDIKFYQLSYDSAPGSTQNFGFPDQIGGIIPGLEITFPEKMQWAFVPTVSALNISGTPDPYMALDAETCGGGTVLRCAFSEDDDTNSPYNGLPEHNQQHVSINTSLISYFLTHTVQEKIEDNILDSQNFNFGETENFPENNTYDNFRLWTTEDYLDKNLTVTGAGQMLINNFDKIGYSDDDNLLTGQGTHFEVRIKKNCEEPTTLIVENGGKLLVGEPGTQSTNSGDLFIGEDVTMIVGNAGTAKINTNSKLIIENGGTVTVDAGGRLESRAGQIIVEDGGILQINNDARLMSTWAGEIIIEDGGTLSIDAAELELQGVNGVLHVYGNLKIVNSFDFTDRGYNELPRGRAYGVSLPALAAKIT